jgi:hypothetical protein
MFKKTNLVLLLMVFISLSCLNSSTECDDIVYGPIIHILDFGKLVTTTANYSSVYGTNECNMYDTIVVFCYVYYPDLNFFKDEITIERIPTLHVKITTLNGGDTEYYPLIWYEPSRGAISAIPPSPGGNPFLFTELRSFALPIVYEPDKAITNDGLLTISQGGDQLYAEMVFKDRKYTAFLDVKTE